MMEASPSASFEVSEPDLLLEVLVIAFDAPAQLGEVDKAVETDLRRQRREPILGRLGFALWPFDQQPLSHQRFRYQLVMPDANTDPREARRQPIGRALSPFDRAPGLLGQSKRQLLGRD